LGATVLVVAQYPAWRERQSFCDSCGKFNPPQWRKRTLGEDRQPMPVMNGSSVATTTVSGDPCNSAIRKASGCRLPDRVAEDKFRPEMRVERSPVSIEN